MTCAVASGNLQQWNTFILDAILSGPDRMGHADSLTGVDGWLTTSIYQSLS
jgi:hypothetical protein